MQDAAFFNFLAYLRYSSLRRGIISISSVVVTNQSWGLLEGLTITYSIFQSYLASKCKHGGIIHTKDQENLPQTAYNLNRQASRAPLARLVRYYQKEMVTS